MTGNGLTFSSLQLRAELRRLGFGLSTLLGLARRGWFIPHRYAAALPAAGELPPYEAAEQAFTAALPQMRARVLMLDDFVDELTRIGGPDRAGTPQAPRWDQAWFPPLDAAIAYALVRTRRPRRIIEVGSGHSTRFLARAVRDGNLPTTILAIDPAPRAAITALGPTVQILQAPVQHAPLSSFDGLGPDDILFIDSSHVLMPGSDVDHLFNRVLPRLPVGALLHVHDILLPDDYPRAWGWRAYNEQLALLPLLAGGGFRPLFASHWMSTRHRDLIAASPVARLPRHPAAGDTSLWLERVG